ncbi:MAG: RluA family pseudouridine synthase [Pseudomonadota bacterium]
MSGVVTVAVSAADAGQRLDRWFKQHYPGVTHGRLEKLLRTGQVRVAGGRAKANRRLEEGEEVRIPPLSAEDAGARPSRRAKADPKDAATLKTFVLYEDDAVLVLNKPFGLAVQGGAKTAKHIDGMLAALETGGERPRLVHRLDRDTGGVLVLGKTRLAAAALSKSFQTKAVDKLYWALCAGVPKVREGTVSLPIAKRMVRIGDGEGERMVAAEGEDAKSAVTDYRVVEAVRAASWLAMRPVTGRTHQLRVHAAAMGAPVVGDGKYGGPAAELEGAPYKLHLFCRRMAFPHPTTGRPVEVVAPLTGHMLETWRFFGFNPDAETVLERPEAARRPKRKTPSSRKSNGRRSPSNQKATRRPAGSKKRP